MNTVLTGFGFMGSWLILLAFFMMNAGKWRDDSYKFHGCNLAGALCVMVSLMAAWNLSIFLLECAWAAIACYGLWRNIKHT